MIKHEDPLDWEQISKEAYNHPDIVFGRWALNILCILGVVAFGWQLISWLVD